ncbi:hypothetical protein ElyMa_003523400 [Elysia marginata]|uniref:Uncharacterized protein n=1 Tax=Elysia marginata TaxID=1093978 RepID=A0AAV4EH40_9GAST|nr:hypothetical protein ElyMa_003523400 [Elysia marginata]
MIVFVCLIFNDPVNFEVISETPLGTIESGLPHIDVRSAQKERLRYTTPSHIILTPGRPDLTLNPSCKTLGGSAAANTNFKVLGLARPGIEPCNSRSLSESFTARPQSRSHDSVQIW